MYVIMRMLNNAYYMVLILTSHYTRKYQNTRVNGTGHSSAEILMSRNLTEKARFSLHLF